jgi:hypothetical protein
MPCGVKMEATDHPMTMRALMQDEGGGYLVEFAPWPSGQSGRA